MALQTFSRRVTSPATSLTAMSLVALVAMGCASWPFHAKERTSILTPGMRMSAIQEMGARAEEIDSTEQARLAEQLATQIQTEPDPLVRKAIQEAIAEYSTPLAGQVLLAGLSDDDLDVRLACCQKLGQRAEVTSIAKLKIVIENDDELDARLAAVDALGNIASPESVSALSIAVNDRDPAMQYAAIQSLRAVSGLDLGNDVRAWRDYAAGKQPQVSPPTEVSVAERIKSYSPF